MQRRSSMRFIGAIVIASPPIDTAKQRTGDGFNPVAFPRDHLPFRRHVTRPQPCRGGSQYPGRWQAPRRRHRYLTRGGCRNVGPPNCHRHRPAGDQTAGVIPLPAVAGRRLSRLSWRPLPASQIER